MAMGRAGGGPRAPNGTMLFTARLLVAGCGAVGEVAVAVAIGLARSTFGVVDGGEALGPAGGTDRGGDATVEAVAVGSSGRGGSEGGNPGRGGGSGPACPMPTGRGRGCPEVGGDMSGGGSTGGAPGGRPRDGGGLPNRGGGVCRFGGMGLGAISPTLVERVTGGALNMEGGERVAEGPVDHRKQVSNETHPLDITIHNTRCLPIIWCPHTLPHLLWLVESPRSTSSTPPRVSEMSQACSPSLSLGSLSSHRTGRRRIHLVRGNRLHRRLPPDPDPAPPLDPFRPQFA